MADVITRLRVESNEYDSKIKRAQQGLLRMEEACRKVGGTLAILEKDEKAYVQSLGSMETVSKTARGRINELTTAFTELSMQYKRLTDEEKQGDFGKALSGSLEQLKTHIAETKSQLADTNRELNGSKFGEFGGIIDDVGHKMGISANLTELLTSKTALMSAGIAASAAIVGKAASEWVKYNKELSRQTQVTTVTTGLTGGGADQMTDQARAVADTYGVDFREVINAANTLMTQFGQTGSQSMQLIRDGMQGMIQGDGPKLLSMIQQYAPSFRDAGISASQLVAIIHNSEGGIFTDQNMNAIVMGIKNIRLMTNQTSEALAKLGIDGQKMSQQLSDGSMTVFQALGQVAEAIERTGSGSKAAGEVMQYVFGRQGAVAGTKLGEAIATLNTNLEETKRQTGELGEAFADLQTANERLNTAIREAFGYDGWHAMATGIKSDLLTALAAVIERLGNIRRMMFGFNRSDASTELAKQGMDAETKLQELQGKKQGSFGQRFNYNSTVREYTKAIEEAQRQLDKLGNTTVSSPTTGMAYDPFAKQRNALEATLKALREEKTAYERQAQLILRGTGVQGNSHMPPPSLTPTTTKPGSTAPEVFPEGSLKQLQQEMKGLQDAQALVTSPEEWQNYQTQIDEVSKRIDQLKGKVADVELFPNLDVTSDAMSPLDALKEKIATSLADAVAQVDETTISTLMRTVIANGIDGLDLDFTSLQEMMAEGLDIPDERFQELQNKINEKLQAKGLGPIKINFETGGLEQLEKTGEGIAKSYSTAAKAISSVSSALDTIKNPGAKVASIIGQTIATIASAYAQTLAKDKSSKENIWAFIAASAAATVSMVTSIAAVKNSTSGYALGGVIPGNSFSGDNQLARVNAGETILTRAQAGIISDALDRSNSDVGNLQPFVMGQQVFLGIGNYLKGAGMGEIVTTKTLRGLGIIN